VQQDATGRDSHHEEALQATVAGLRETLAATLAQIAVAYDAGHLTEAERDAEAAAASARYERDYELATIAADTGWRCWRGVIPMLYASRPKTSPPMIVRAATPEALREAIEKAEAGLR
jgi:hypothetical protein